MKTCDPGDFPKRVEIEIASACNLRCSYCPRRHMEELAGFIDMGLFKKIIDEASEYPDTTLVLHRRGESLLHKNFKDICDMVKGRFKEVQIATNATLLNEAKSKKIIEAIDFISFSIDSPRSFDKTRAPAKYENVESNVLKFLDINKGKVKTQVSMVQTTETDPEDAHIFKELWHGKVDRIRIYEEHSRDGKFGSLNKKRPVRLPCVMPFYELLIYCDGKIGRCNHDWESSPMGDANTASIKQIWKNSLYTSLRKQHTDLDITDEVCKGCDSWYPSIGDQGTGEAIE